MGSNKICSDTCVVVATDPVLKKLQLSNPVNQVLENKKTENKASGVTFADVTKHGKFKSKNLKSRILKSTVLDVSNQVPSFEDFPPLGGVPVKARVPTKKVRNKDLPTKKGGTSIWAGARTSRTCGR